ncbi:hypothetical protein, partial [Escherichia coli]|uniref:hypothetical protein n=1 Tax=Escherichia coli TaxID=562 RepID=UPI0021E722D7
GGGWGGWGWVRGALCWWLLSRRCVVGPREPWRPPPPPPPGGFKTRGEFDKMGVFKKKKGGGFWVLKKKKKNNNLKKKRKKKKKNPKTRKKIKQ